MVARRDLLQEQMLKDGSYVSAIQRVAKFNKLNHEEIDLLYETEEDGDDEEQFDIDQEVVPRGRFQDELKFMTNMDHKIGHKVILDGNEQALAIKAAESRKKYVINHNYYKD
jgi:hypothetical protein